MDNKCQVKNCRQPSSIKYYGKGICDKHWKNHCNEESNFDLKEEFKL